MYNIISIAVGKIMCYMYVLSTCACTCVCVVVLVSNVRACMYVWKGP